MIVKFKGPRTLDGVTYEKGERSLDDSLQHHWFFKALIKSNDVTIIEAPSEDVPPAEGVLSHIPSATLNGRAIAFGENGKPMFETPSEEISQAESDHTITTEVVSSEVISEMREEDKQKVIQKAQSKVNAHNSHSKKRG